MTKNVDLTSIKHILTSYNMVFIIRSITTFLPCIIINTITWYILTLSIANNVILVILVLLLLTVTQVIIKRRVALK